MADRVKVAMKLRVNLNDTACEGAWLGQEGEWAAQNVCVLAER